MSDAMSEIYKAEREYEREYSKWKEQLGKSEKLADEYQNISDEIDETNREYKRKLNDLISKLEFVKEQINAL
jgi:hypothetical protein